MDLKMEIKKELTTVCLTSLEEAYQLALKIEAQLKHSTLKRTGVVVGGFSTSQNASSVPRSNRYTKNFIPCLLYQEDYNQLNEALAGTDHSWTALTLKLCSVLETADKLVQSANSNIRLLLEKVGMIESIIRRGDSAIAAGKAILGTLNKQGPSTGSQNNK
ncbi:hypothetical protein HHK36_009026 [Tetracentron sinense]|uniref:Uncharacterized protein n=1 Tax=Tetracentron sinense TaxID=13715 RepID=A0A835DI08_TETSI|nr:hypothetical protein HHK36_009026 [Tetracentron sinense]